MKMADGGFRPAFNAQLTTATGSQVIVGVDVTAASNDLGQLPPMAEQLQRRYGHAPQEVLADGGFVNLDDIRALAHPGRGAVVYAPPTTRRRRGPRSHHRPDDEVIAEWRHRMATPAAQAIYRERAATSECVNAIARNRGLQRFMVRGLRKTRAVLLWFALAHNVLRAVSLRRLAGCPT
jgi:IS5 family transposase